MLSSGRSREVVVCGTAGLVACLLVHAQALGGFFLADDYTIIGSFWGKDLHYLLSLLASDEIGGVWNEQFVRPVRSWSLAIDGRLWGLEPFGFHLTNLLLHASVSTLVGVMVLHLGGGIVAGFLASLLFLLHPLNVEVATWISGRDESLCALTLLGAMRCYLAAQERGRKPLLMIASCALFAASLFTKEYGVLFPLALWVWGMVRGRSLGKTIRSSLPYLGITALFLGIRWLAIGHPFVGYGGSGEGHFLLSFELLFESIAGFVRDLWTPAAEHPFPAAIGVLSVMLVAVRSGPASARELALIGYWLVLWPLIFLMPTHNLVYTPRHLFISFAGVAIAFGLVLARARGRSNDALTFAVGVFLVALLVPPTMVREEEFARMSNRCRAALSAVGSFAHRALPNDVLVLVNMPAHQTPPWGFGWSLEDALKPPFSGGVLDTGLEIIHRRQWRPEAWDAYRQRYPNHGVHVLAWNPAFSGIEILRESRIREK